MDYFYVRLVFSMKNVNFIFCYKSFSIIIIEKFLFKFLVKKICWNIASRHKAVFDKWEIAPAGKLSCNVKSWDPSISLPLYLSVDCP